LRFARSLQITFMLSVLSAPLSPLVMKACLVEQCGNERGVGLLRESVDVRTAFVVDKNRKRRRQ